MPHRELRKSRVLVAAAGFLLAFLALWLRSAWLQLPMHAAFEARAQGNWGQIEVVPPERGKILDRHGRPLARDLLTPSGSIFVQISDENLHHVREEIGRASCRERVCLAV